MPVDEKKIAGHCPKCNSANSELTGESVYSHDTYTDSMKCLDCGEKWVEFFKYAGYDLIN